MSSNDNLWAKTNAYKTTLYYDEIWKVLQPLFREPGNTHTDGELAVMLSATGIPCSAGVVLKVRNKYLIPNVWLRIAELRKAAHLFVVNQPIDLSGKK